MGRKRVERPTSNFQRRTSNSTPAAYEKRRKPELNIQYPTPNIQRMKVGEDLNAEYRLTRLRRIKQKE